jgi:UrcA family protein
MITKSKLSAIAAVLALGGIAAGHSVQAQDSETASVNVSYGDLNLATPAGARTMYQRIQSAARTICGAEPSAPLDRAMIYEGCVRSTTDRAVAKFGNPNVAAISGHGSAPTTLASNR